MNTETKELSEEDIVREAVHLVRTLPFQERATVLGLYGDLGAGKTTFAQALARALGITESVTSPTFVIIKTYTLPKGKTHFTRFIHIDAYRLKNSEELKKLGWETMLKNPENLIVLEWADRVEDILPKHTKKIHMDISNEKTRIFSYEG